MKRLAKIRVFQGVAHLTLLALLPLALQACSGLGSTSKLSNQRTLADYAWGETVYLEPHSDHPDALSVPGVKGFEAVKVPGEEALWLAATFFNPATGNWDGFARRYTPSEGWAAAGQFFRVVTAEAFSYGAVQIAADQSGGLLALFFEDDETLPSNQITPIFYSGDWESPDMTQPYISSSFFGRNDDAELTDDGYGATLGLPHDLWLSRDRPGQGAFFSAKSGLTRTLSGMPWSRSAGLGADHVSCSKPMQTELTGSDSASALQIVDDGMGSICVFTEDQESGTAGVNAHCAGSLDWVSSAFATNTALQQAFSPAAVAGTDASISGSNPAGLVAAASDALGTTLAVFWRESDEGESQLVARERISGEWTEDLVLITTVDSAGYTSAFQQGFPVPPALTALSEGQFLVVWQAYDIAAGLSTLFFSIRDAEGEWTRPRSVGVDLIYDPDDGVLADDERASVDGLWLFSNGSGEAALAIRYFGSDLAAEGDIEKLPRRWIFSRFSESEFAWSEFVTRARPGYEEIEEVGCTTANTSLNHCTHPPSGAVFEDGSAVIVFPTEDNEGRARLGSVVFE